jgi:hypothetical protein
MPSSLKNQRIIKKNGAKGGNRTRTVLPPQDFKSCASTSSATLAQNKGRKFIKLQEDCLSDNFGLFWGNGIKFFTKINLV